MKDMIDKIENMIASDREKTIKSKDLINRVLAKNEEIIMRMKKPSIISEKLEPAAITIPVTCVCGKPWYEKTKYCRYCGSSKPAVEALVLKCPNGHDIASDAKFCRICGIKL